MADADGQIPMMEVGATGGDLPYWCMKAAVRHAELRLGGQAQTAHAPQGRATALLVWNVTGLLLPGAAVANGTHRVPAVIAATCLRARPAAVSRHSSRGISKAWRATHRATY